MSYMSECRIIIDEAAEHGITLDLSDFYIVPETRELTIDGMDPSEWLDAMTDNDDPQSGTYDSRTMEE